MGRREISTERGKITQENVGHIITECMICAHGNGDGHYDSRLRANYTLYIIGPPLAVAQLPAQLQLIDQDSAGMHRMVASPIIRNIGRTDRDGPKTYQHLEHYNYKRSITLRLPVCDPNRTALLTPHVPNKTGIPDKISQKNTASGVAKSQHPPPRGNSYFIERVPPRDFLPETSRRRGLPLPKPIYKLHIQFPNNAFVPRQGEGGGFRLPRK